MLSKKVILIGKFGVGKTSLVRQLVHQIFSEDYLTTIGVKIDKKVIDLNGTEVSLLIWDIAGETSQDKVPHSYKLGSHGIIYVFDLTRPTTYENLHAEISELTQLLPGASYKIVGNKSDLINEKDALSIVEQLNIPEIYLSSAKNGENVEKLFLDITQEMIQ